MHTTRAKMMGNTFFSGFGQAILDKLSHIVDKMPSSDDVDYFNRVAEACSRLVEIADELTKSGLRTKFIADCTSLINRCEKESKRSQDSVAVQDTGTCKSPLLSQAFATKQLPQLPSIHPNPVVQDTGTRKRPPSESGVCS